ncbi:uncharacterized protein LOC132724777 isoform X2 [Ruditapes philippinarum]|uniref:uncharacterized protein LOC132724777 isoform X2 n=1 Tax=Ruditapes philippinarum TaxID=129788 RepID=UPI00295A8335|nr:uncharacterized protein LOC132724777 isoform X2 [Ruditapes philippinarum]
MGKCTITFMLFVLLIVFMKASESKPTLKQNILNRTRGLAKGIGNGNGRCNDHDQCPDGYACLLAEGKKVKKCLQLLPPCPMGWYQNRNSCYIYDCTANDWLSAVSHCQSLSPSGYPNSHIVEITDEEESQVAFAISITGFR